MTPKEMIAAIREKGAEFRGRSEKLRRDAREMEIRASELYDAFISFDLLADKLETKLAEASPPADPAAQPASTDRVSVAGQQDVGE